MNEIIEHLLVSTEVHATDSQVVSSPDESRANLESLIVGIYGLLITVTVCICSAQLVPQQVIAWLDLEGCLEAVGCFVVLSGQME